MSIDAELLTILNGDGDPTLSDLARWADERGLCLYIDCVLKPAAGKVGIHAPLVVRVSGDAAHAEPRRSSEMSEEE